MTALKLFEENIRSTDLFTARIHAMSTYLKPAKPEQYPKNTSPQLLKFVSFDETHFDKIFEVGFIAQFANFEYFMYDFLRELYTKYPKAIPGEKTIKIEDILEFSNLKSVRGFLIDMIAIENSYDLEIWNNTTQKLFNIKPISDEVRVRLMIMNSMRNLYMHSGGRWNSKALKDSKKIEKALISVQTSDEIKKTGNKRQTFATGKSAMPAEMAYKVTLDCFNSIIKDINLQLEKKKNRKKNNMKKASKVS